MYNLTDNQKDVARWFVEKAMAGELNEEFTVMWAVGGKTLIGGYRPASGERDEILCGAGTLDALAANGLLLAKPTDRGHYQCTLLGRVYEAVASDFNAPDTSFVKHLTPLADVTNLDDELKQRCLPILGADSADPKLWDSAVRVAGVILEERMRDVGGIVDHSKVGRELVNTLFGDQGTLAGKFAQPSERLGYRELYAGMVGTFRNPYAHRLIDPKPEDGGAFLVFVNLLLKMLEDLR